MHEVGVANKEASGWKHEVDVSNKVVIIVVMIALHLEGIYIFFHYKTKRSKLITTNSNPVKKSD